MNDNRTISKMLLSDKFIRIVPTMLNSGNTAENNRMTISITLKCIFGNDILGHFPIKFKITAMKINARENVIVNTFSFNGCK